MLSTGQGLKDLTGNVHIDTLECRNLSATNFDIQNLQVSTSLIPTQDNVVDLGSTAKRFKRAYVNDIDLGVTRASKQLKTDASGVVAFDPLLSVGTSNGLTLNSGTQVLDLALASGSAAGAITSSTYNDIVANTAARHSAITLGTSNGLSLAGQQLSLATASSTTTGALTSTDWSTFNGKASGTGYQPSKVMVTSGTGAINTTDTTSDQIYALSYVTPGRALITHPTLAEVRSSTTTATEIGYLSGVTSSVQNQISNKQDILFNTTSTGGENFLTPVTAVPAYTLNLANHASVSGKLGIGIGGSASGAKLHVRDTTSGVRAVLDVTASAYTGASVGLWFGNTSSNYPYAQIDGIDGQPVSGQVFLGDLAFRTNTNQTMNERMRIKAWGGVGIGTSAPENVLHVASDTSGVTVGSSSQPNRRLVMGYDPTNNRAYIQSVEQGVSVRSLLLNPSGGSVNISATQSKGTLQIGDTAHVTNARSGLVLNGGENTWVALDAGAYAASDRVVLGTLANKATLGGHNDSHSAWADLVLNPSGGTTTGLVGVGTAAPAYKLHVFGDVNTGSGTYRRDGLPIQALADRPIYINTNINLAQAPWYLNWTEMGYVDIPHAGIWYLRAGIRLYFTCNDSYIRLTFATNYGIAGASENTSGHYTGNVGTLNADPFYHYQTSCIMSTSGPQRLFLNASCRHVSGGSPNIYPDGGYISAARVG